MARHVGMFMHAMWVTINEGRLKHMRLSKGKEASSSQLARSRRQQMVALHIADVSLLFFVMVWRRAFSHEDPSIVSFTV